MADVTTLATSPQTIALNDDSTVNPTRRIRVAHVLPWPGVGGTEMATLRLAVAAQDYGYESIALVVEGHHEVKDFFEANGIKVYPFQEVEPSIRRPRRYLANAVRLSQLLQEQRVDLVHFSEVLGAHFAGLATRMAKLPHICHVRNRYDSINGRDRLFLRLIRNFAFVSHDTWRRFAHTVPPARGRVLYDGFQATTPEADHHASRESVLKEYGLPPETVLIGTLARVHPQKDYFTLAEAAAQLLVSHPNARFIVVGDNSLNSANREHFKEVKAHLERLGIFDRFIFTGFRKDTGRFLGAFDIFVLSTHAEGLPLVLLEAAAYGKPIVATGVDGVPEAVLHEETGLIYKERDGATLTAHLNRLVEDPTLARRYGMAARNAVAERFSMAGFAESVDEMYQDLLHRFPKAPRV